MSAELITSGANVNMSDINHTDFCGFTALSRACQKVFPKCVNLLLRAELM